MCVCVYIYIARERVELDLIEIAFYPLMEILGCQQIDLCRTLEAGSFHKRLLFVPRCLRMVLCHAMSFCFILKPSFVMCTESCNFTVLCAVQMPHHCIGLYLPYSIVFSLEDMQLNVVGSGTRRLYRAYDNPMLQQRTCSPMYYIGYVRGGADTSLARPGRKQAKATKLGIYSTYS